MRLQIRPSAGSEGLRSQPHPPQESRAPRRRRNYALVATPSSIDPSALALRTRRRGRASRGIVHGRGRHGRRTSHEARSGGGAAARGAVPRRRGSAFAESPEGARALHRTALAAIVVFGVMLGAGAATLRMFFLVAGLSDWIACSESTQRRTQARVVGAIGSWGDDTLRRLGRTIASPRADPRCSTRRGSAS